MIFRTLNEQETKDFARWAREHPADMKAAVISGRASIFHPAVREEWNRMVQAGEVEGPLAPVGDDDRLAKEGELDIFAAVELVIKKGLE